MNQQEILYNNKVIAHYMDGKYWPKSWNPFKKFHNAYEFPGFRLGVPPDQLLFHNHWNWLMWVIEKIQRDYPEIKITMEDRQCTMELDGQFKMTRIAHDRFAAIYHSILGLIRFRDDQRRDKEMKKATEYAESLKNPSMF